MTAPSKFAHVVYNTHRYDEMIEWYTKVFEARTVHRGERLTFLTYDDEHHRFAFINLGPMPDDAPEPRMGRGVGVHHVAYTWNGLGELVALYKRLKAVGVVPNRPIRHGMTLSMYYDDPDGNLMEFQIDLVEPDDATEFMSSAAFEANPIGELFDPDALVAAYESDGDLNEFVFRSDQEPVAIPGA